MAYLEVLLQDTGLVNRQTLLAKEAVKLSVLATTNKRTATGSYIILPIRCSIASTKGGMIVVVHFLR